MTHYDTDAQGLRTWITKQDRVGRLSGDDVDLLTALADRLDRAPRPITADDPEPAVGSVIGFAEPGLIIAVRRASGWLVAGAHRVWSWETLGKWLRNSGGGVLLRDGSLGSGVTRASL